MGSLARTYSDRKVNGRIYTPDAIVARTLDLAGFAGPDAAGARLLDPACGDGQFLVEAARRVLKAAPGDAAALEHLHGWDTDAGAVAACRARLDRLVAPHGLAVDWNVRAQDALASSGAERFDFVVGNPPYVRIQHLDADERARIQDAFRFCATGSTDLYLAFFELGLKRLAPGGTLGYVTPNSYFHSAAGRVLRGHLAGEDLERGGRLRHLVNYGSRQVFPDATVYATITVAQNEPAPAFAYTDASREAERVHPVEAAALQGQREWRLGPATGPLDPERFRPLGEIARIHAGLATLADAVFIVEPDPEADPAAETVRVATKRFGTVEIERALLRPIVKASRVKPGGPCLTGLYTLFPYLGATGTLLPEAELRARFPLGFRYLERARPILERRDNGRPNPIGWYAFGRSQALKTSIGPKIVVPPLAKEPTFVVCEHPEATLYAGYFIRYDGDLHALAAQLSGDRMRAWVQTGSRDYLGGWKGYGKAALRDFPVDTAALKTADGGRPTAA